MNFQVILLIDDSIAVANIFVNIQIASAPSLNFTGIYDAFLKQRVWEEEFIQFLSAIAVMHWTLWIMEWIAPGWFQGNDEFILFFKIVLGKTASTARNWISSSPQTKATTFAFSSVFILLYVHFTPGHHKKIKWHTDSKNLIANLQ